jgi:hypothetical protein
MNLCSNEHEEVCFEGRQCPVCEVMENLGRVQGELDEKEIALETANEKIDELNSDIADFKNTAPQNSGTVQNSQTTAQGPH